MVSELSADSWSSCAITQDVTVAESFQTNTPNHIVLLDGYRNGKPSLETFFSETRKWSHEQSGTRRLVIVASSRDSNDADAYLYEDEFFEEFCTEEEYVAACKHPELLKSVLSKLDTPLCIINPSRQELISAEFNYAGSSARLLFFYETEKVIKEIRRAVCKVDSAPPYIAQCVGRGSILSQFASLELAMKGGLGAITAIRQGLKAHGNKAIDGWIFELIFFARLATQYYLRHWYL